MKKRFRVLLPILFFVFAAAGFFATGHLFAQECYDPFTGELIECPPEDPPEGTTADSPPRGADASEAIHQAVANNEMTLKEAVMSKAMLLFDPSSLSAYPPAAFLEGNTSMYEPSLTGFYRDVHKVYDQLSTEEKDYLSAIDPSLAAVIAIKDREATGIPPGTVSGLPTGYSNLDKTVEGTHCVIHYTDNVTDTDKIPMVGSPTYPTRVKNFIEAAYTAYYSNGTRFLPALPETDGTTSKLHVYLKGSMPYKTWSAWVDGSTVPNSDKKSGWIIISTKVNTEGAAASWGTSLKGACYNAYFGGVQSAYNSASSGWFRDGLARWAQRQFASDNTFITQDFQSPVCVSRAPELPIWDESSRRYCTITLAYHLANKYGGINFIKSYLLGTQTQNDAIEVLKDLMIDKGTTFNDEMKKFWVAIYRRSISPLSGFMPDPPKETRRSYGVSGNGRVYQLGARFHELYAMVGIPKASLIYSYLPASGANVTAYSFLATAPNTLKDIDAANLAEESYDDTANFGGSQKVVIVYTDMNYVPGDRTERQFAYKYLLPYIKITGYTVSGSNVNITYNLLGTIAGQSFPTQVAISGQGVAPNSSGEFAFPSGTTQIHTYPLTEFPAAGTTYRHTVTFSVPANSWYSNWGIAQVPSTYPVTIRGSD
jgi:hypothetical protein